MQVETGLMDLELIPANTANLQPKGAEQPRAQARFKEPIPAGGSEWKGVRRKRGEYVRISDRHVRVRQAKICGEDSEESGEFIGFGAGIQGAWRTLAGLAHNWIQTAPSTNRISPLQAGPLPEFAPKSEQPRKLPAGNSGRSQALHSSQRDTAMPRVMVICFHAAERQRICKSLDPRHYELVEAGSGKEAVAKAQQMRIDLIIMDVVKPGMSGQQMLRLLGLSDSIKVVVVADYPEAWPFAQDAYGTTVVGRKAGSDGLREQVRRLFLPDGGDRLPPLEIAQYATMSR